LYSGSVGFDWTSGRQGASWAWATTPHAATIPAANKYSVAALRFCMVFLWFATDHNYVANRQSHRGGPPE
jgi:hypothetical protein